MSDDVILETRDLVIEKGGKRILDRLSLQVWSGHVHAVVGPNGAGKSTLASTIMGLAGYERPGGDVLFEGRSLIGLPVDARARLGITMAWQEPARFEGLSVRTFVGAGVAAGSDRKVGEALELVGLSPDAYLSRAVDRSLSGGERKRIELASILVMEPRLVLMDEPDSGIDVEALSRIFAAIRHLQERGATVLLITHSTAVLEQAEHAFLVCCGRLVDKGSAAKIKTYFGNRCLPCDHQNQPAEQEAAR